MEDFLFQRNQQVVDNVIQSTLVLSGSHQGSILRPLLFICFINTCQMFTDDTKMFKTVNSPDQSSAATRRPGWSKRMV